VNLLHKIPGVINLVSSVNCVPAVDEYPKVDKPLRPPDEKSMPEPSKPASPKSVQGPIGIEGTPISPSYATSSHDVVNIPPRPVPTKIPKVSPPSPSPTDSRHPVGRIQVKVQPCLHPRHNCVHFCVLQCPCGTILISSRLDFTTVNMLQLPSTPKLKERTTRCSSPV
jgi:hypothetical protein